MFLGNGWMSYVTTQSFPITAPFRYLVSHQAFKLWGKAAIFIDGAGFEPYNILDHREHIFLSQAQTLERESV